MYEFESKRVWNLKPQGLALNFEGRKKTTHLKSQFKIPFTKGTFIKKVKKMRTMPTKYGM